MTRPNAALVVALIAATSIMAAACGGDAGTKAGGDAEPATLRLAAAYNVEPGLPYFVDKPVLHSLLELVDTRSDGGVRIEVDVTWPHWDHADAEQRIVAAVAAGDVELGWVGVRAFSELGVTSFDALTAPLLIDSYQLQGAVIDSEIPHRMLADLDEIGVTGLAVFGGGLRRPIGTEGTLLNPDDFADTAFHAVQGQRNTQAVAALGAESPDVAGRDVAHGLADGTITGVERELLVYHNQFEAIAPYVTLNVNLWPDMHVLIANPQALADLAKSQAELLTETALDTAAHSVEIADVDASLLDDLCRAGARLAEATEADLAAFRTSFEPLYAELEQDVQTQQFIARVRELKATAGTDPPLTVPEGCTGEPGTSVALPTPLPEGDDPSVLNGTYRINLTVDDLYARGWPRDLETGGMAGSWTLTLADGAFELMLLGDPETCPGTYTVDGSHITMVAADGPEWGCGADHRGLLIADMAWELTDRELGLFDAAISDEVDHTWAYNALLTTHLWTRVD